MSEEICHNIEVIGWIDNENEMRLYVSKEDMHLAKVFLKRLTGHSNLISIFMYGNREQHDDLFSTALQNMILGTKNLQKIQLDHFEFTYNMIKPFVDAILNTNCKSLSCITELHLGDCTWVDECRLAVGLLHDVLTKSTTTRLELGNANETDLTISNWSLLGMLAKESNLLVLDLKSITEAHHIEEGPNIEEQNNDEGLIAEFWETLTTNKSLQFLLAPPMSQHDIHFDPFVQSVPKLNIRGLQTNIYNAPNVNTKRYFEFLNAFKNNFSLFHVHVYIFNDGDYSDNDGQPLPSMDETVVTKLKWYCTRNIVLDQLFEPSNEEMEKRRWLRHKHEELEENENAYALVKPLPDTLWSTFLYKLKDCDSQYQNQAIFRSLICGMLDSIGMSKTNANACHPLSCNVSSLLSIEYTKRFAVIACTETRTDKKSKTTK